MGAAGKKKKQPKTITQPVIQPIAYLLTSGPVHKPRDFSQCQDSASTKGLEEKLIILLTITGANTEPRTTEQLLGGHSWLGELSLPVLTHGQRKKAHNSQR